MDLKIAAILLCSGVALKFGSLADALPAAGLRELVQGEGDAHAACHRLVDIDTHAFGSCLDRLLASEPAETPRRLGIEYVGVVGALNWSRPGTGGAEQTARDWLARVRVTQAALAVHDDELCATIAGDCGARIARMKLLDAAPPIARAD